MGLYGNTFMEEYTEIGNYIDTYFLEEVLNEGANNAKNKIKELLNKDDITESDLKKVVDMIYNEKDKSSKWQMAGMAIGTIIIIIGTFMAFSSSTITILKGGTTAVAGYIVTLLAASKEPDEPYEKLMKLEAKARKNLNRAKAAEDEEKIKKFEKAIELFEAIKKEYRQKLRNKFLGVDESAIEDTDIITEMKGNEIKNDVFKQVLDDLDDLCKMNLEKIKSYDTAIENIIKTANTVNKENSKETIVEMRKIGRKVIEDRNKIKGYYGSLSFQLLKKQVTSFNNKYSYVTMQEKKKLVEKLRSYKKIIEKYAKKYSSKEFENRYIDIIDKFEIADSSLRTTVYDFIDSWVSELMDECNYTIADIDSIINQLNIGATEKSIKYKLLNFVELRKERKANKNK